MSPIIRTVFGSILLIGGLYLIVNSLRRIPSTSQIFDNFSQINQTTSGLSALEEPHSSSLPNLTSDTLNPLDKYPSRNFKNKSEPLKESSIGSELSKSEKVSSGGVKKIKTNSYNSNKQKNTIHTSFKEALLKILKNEGWREEELWLVSRWLDDPRTQLREDLLVKISTYEENAELYQKFLTPPSIEDCLNQWRLHRKLLEEVERSMKVSPPYILAILKVESNFGIYPGNESLFNVFWSLSLGDSPGVIEKLNSPEGYPVEQMRSRMKRRAIWARGQLRDLVYIYRHYGIDPLEAKGSFAGAYGMMQFIPSSIRAFVKDGDGNGIIDLNALPDAAFSLANYLRENGWKPDGNRQHKRKVLLTYNRSPYYADCILALADSLSSKLSNAHSF